MTKLKKTKYAILIISGILTLYINTPYVDSCQSMCSVFIFLILIILFGLTIVISISQSIFNLISKKEKFDFIPLAFLVVFILTNGFLLIGHKNKFWRKIRYKGQTETNMEVIELYENNTFEATIQHGCSSCLYVGRYHIEKKLTILGDQTIIILDDENIESKTHGTFTNLYLLIPKSILQPLNKKEGRIYLENK
ncbi:hypothetical protein CLU81_0532 [Flavobacterium sp. 9]|uniref:hypothetical protein n=1 Tax=Flavobacterium sp. 9 TaxID=2035198 RepID=UPI000C18FA40|nr:hypothetical protein [Flavobacterium sp. 9]PIF30129.1 hypothetical protein CLU81_0532 [Flavobacterium sp. 9]